MSRRPPTDQSIYQVDLVAGLFGGFMLIWITSTKDSSLPAAPPDPPTLALVETVATFTDPVTGEKDSFAVVDPEFMRLTCLDEKTAEQAGIDITKAMARCPAAITLIGEGGVLGIELLSEVPRATQQAACFDAPAAPGNPVTFSYGLAAEFHRLDGFAPIGFLMSPDTVPGVWDSFETEAPVLAPTTITRIYVDQSGNTTEVSVQVVPPPPRKCSWDRRLESFQVVYRVDSKDETAAATTVPDVWNDAVLRAPVPPLSTALPAAPAQANGQAVDRPAFVVLSEAPGRAVLSLLNQSEASAEPPGSEVSLRMKICVFRDGQSRCFLGEELLKKGQATIDLFPVGGA